MCGPGFTLVGVTCHDHDSDWEGITVILREDGGELAPEAVTYAQHEVGVTYAWGDLVERWEGEERLIDEHPVVYVAAGSHASYAEPCPDRPCDQVVLPEVRKDGPHGGDNPWPMNDERACIRQGICLKPLPKDVRGEPALWNAFRGPWGRRRCVLLRAVCDIGRAPTAPSFQDRYREPWKARDKGERKQFAGLSVLVGKYSD